MTRIRVAGTVDVAVALDLDKEVEAQQKQAATSGVETPTTSDVLQDVMKKGLAQLRSNRLRNMQ